LAHGFDASAAAAGLTVGLATGSVEAAAASEGAGAADSGAIDAAADGAIDSGAIDAWPGTVTAGAVVGAADPLQAARAMAPSSVIAPRRVVIDRVIG
jgi:hypothetical protein